MDGERIIESYEAVLTLTRRMLDAARASRWDELIATEDERARLIDEISKIDLGGTVAPPQRDNKRELISTIMQQDAEIRILTQDWMHELRVVISSLNAQQRLHQTYGDSGLPN